MKKRNLIMVGILFFLLAITALFFVVGAADINDYPDEVLGLKDGNVRVIYSATSSEKLHTYRAIMEYFPIQNSIRRQPKYTDTRTALFIIGQITKRTFFIFPGLRARISNSGLKSI